MLKQPWDAEVRVCTCVEAEALKEMLVSDIRARFCAANERQAAAWAKVTSKAEWEAFRDQRIDALRRSLGQWPPAEVPLQAEVTGRLPGDGFAVEKVLYTTRPGLVVTANLYLPHPPPPEPMPAVVICHSHHRPKGQGELQDMGMNWARSGAAVLVIDQLGHGERRQQPFGGREDYRWRYLEGIQLDLVGESLIGWMVWDMIRGIDLLAARGDVDPERIVLLGAVAGGGDPVAVLAALSDKPTCVAPFNFGGPEGAGGADADVNWACSGSWETTRNLRESARDGFFPWVIDAAAAPRHFVLGCEFEYGRGKRLVWDRLERVYGWYGAADRLALVRGWGEVTKRPPEASHCTNIGAPHREQLYPPLEKWLGMAPPLPEIQQRLEPEELDCLTDDARGRLRPRKLHELLTDLAADRLAAARAARADLTPDQRRRKLRDELAERLRSPAPAADPLERQRDVKESDAVAFEAITLEVEPGIVVPMVLLRPADGASAVVVGLAQQGKARFLAERGGEIASLLARGLAVCLPDLRGCGETCPAADHNWHLDWNALGTWISSSELMLGRTLLGSRVRDVLSVLRYLAARPDAGGGRAALWGDSFAPVNPPDLEELPLAAETPAHTAEPMGALAALLAGLLDDRVAAVAARRGIVGYASLLDHWACHVPHDVVVPGVLQVADVADVAAALAPRPLRLTEFVDGRNRAATQAALDEAYAPAVQAYADHPDRLSVAAGAGGPVGDWLAAALTAGIE